MNTGDSPSQQSEAGVVAQPDWRPGADLTALEYEIVRNAEIGRLAGVRDGEYDLAAMRTWGQGRTVRATVLRHLLVDEEWPVHSRGVRLRAVRISGRLDLEAATVRCPLILNYCYFDEPVQVNLSYATVPWLHFTGCYLAGLTGVMLKVTKDFDVRGV